MDKRLLRPARFRAALERIADNRRHSPTVLELQQDGVSLTTLVRNAARFARLLCRDLAEGRLAPTPGIPYRVHMGKRARTLFRFDLKEMVIQGAVAGWLGEVGAASLGEGLYSYRAGVAYHLAVRDFARYVRTRRRAAPDLRRWGLFVARRDIRSYFDAIPVHAGAPLWAILDRHTAGASAREREIVARAVRPLLVDETGNTYLSTRGICTGSPVANVVANLYLLDLDDRLRRISGGFYARYGDDILIASESIEHIRAARAVLGRQLDAMGLESQRRKAGDLYLNAAGRSCVQSPREVGSTAVDFLGHRITALGEVRLTRSSTRAFLDAVRVAARRAVRPLAASALERRARAAVEAANLLMDPFDVQASHHARQLRFAVTDRGYLKWLDHEVRLAVLGAVFGGRNVRHHRALSPRRLRNGLALRSLVHERNRVGRPRAR